MSQLSQIVSIGHELVSQRWLIKDCVVAEFLRHVPADKRGMRPVPRVQLLQRVHASCKIYRHIERSRELRGDNVHTKVSFHPILVGGIQYSFDRVGTERSPARDS